ncbi:unnamed protein product [Spirodela intermedia]|uniref:Uncharacterized protein n=1 Tax=Spirodela intermedia TaxID=51605 RepID=A0A7I8IKM9_SPIIN|nr:unnamed protein product [Spirodela intermedia]CAA6658429.1 unnamed protein product [Spirodela intermedia]
MIDLPPRASPPTAPPYPHLHANLILSDPYLYITDRLKLERASERERDMGGG